MVSFGDTELELKYQAQGKVGHYYTCANDSVPTATEIWIHSEPELPTLSPVIARTKKCKVGEQSD